MYYCVLHVETAVSLIYMYILLSSLLPLLVYGARKYIECVKSCAEMSMAHAVEAAKHQPDYSQTGEVPLSHCTLSLYIVSLCHCCYCNLCHCCYCNLLVFTHVW